MHETYADRTRMILSKGLTHKMRTLLLFYRSVLIFCVEPTYFNLSGQRKTFRSSSFTIRAARQLIILNCGLIQLNCAMKYTKTILFPLVLSLLLSSSDTQAPCSDQGKDDCGLDKRFCVATTAVTGGQKDVCTVCLDGFVEFREACFEIDALDFQDFRKSYAPLYADDDRASPVERLARLKVLATIISRWNARFPPPLFRLELNQYSADLDFDRNQLLGYRHVNGTDDAFPRFNPESPDERRHLARSLQASSLPDRVDWVEQSAVTFVKDQGRCGCCWAVSLAGAIEGSAALTPGNSDFLQSVSFQQLISCDTSNHGCNGGSMVTGMLYSTDNSFGGLASLNDYPFSDDDGDTAKTCATSDKELLVDPDDPRLVLTFDDQLSFDERLELMKAAVARQPVSITLKSGCDRFSSYKDGIINDDGDCACEVVSCIDHAVLLVGYDDTASNPFWKLKNSWGDSWGEGGYFRISQQSNDERWGLFGMLGQGVITLQAFNATGAEPDKQDDDELENWAIGLICIAAVLCPILTLLCWRSI